MSGLTVKLAGGIMVVIAGFLFSKILTDKLKSDIRIADGMISGFISLEEYICGMLMPVENALVLASSDAGDACKMFLYAAECDGNMSERFLKSMKKYNIDFCDSVCDFVQGICAVDEKGRRTAFSVIRSRLSDIRENAAREYARLGRLYNTMGISCGVVIVILLF